MLNRVVRRTASPLGIALAFFFFFWGVLRTPQRHRFLNLCETRTIKNVLSLFKIYDEPLSPNEGAACLRYMVNRYRQMRGRV